MPILVKKGEILAFGGAGRFNTGAGYEYATGEASGFDKQTEQKAYEFISKRMSVSCFPLTLNIGARGIHYNTYQDTLNPEMSLKYTQGAFSCRFTAAQTSNVPSSKKKYQETSTTQPNPDLNLEKATNFGLSFTWERDDGLRRKKWV